MSEKISITWGEEVYQPLKYNGFRLGPYTVEIEVKPDETMQQAFDRGWKFLEDQALVMFTAKKLGFHGRVMSVMEIAKQGVS